VFCIFEKRKKTYKSIRPCVQFKASLAARPRTYLLQTDSYDVSIHPRHLSDYTLRTSVLDTFATFHPCCRHDIQTTAALFYLSSSGSSASSYLYSRKAGVSGFGCHRLERPASPRRICAVTRGFQTRFPVPTMTLSHYHMTPVLLLPFITILSGHLWSLQ